MSKLEQRPTQRATWRARALVVLAVLVVLAGMLWRATLPDRALEGLPREARSALYGRTIESLATVCRSHPANLEDFCRDQAELALRFPECDAACRSLADPHLPRSSR